MESKEEADESCFEKMGYEESDEGANNNKLQEFVCVLVRLFPPFSFRENKMLRELVV